CAKRGVREKEGIEGGAGHKKKKTAGSSTARTHMAPHLAASRERSCVLRGDHGLPRASENYGSACSDHLRVPTQLDVLRAGGGVRRGGVKVACLPGPRGSSAASS